MIVGKISVGKVTQTPIHYDALILNNKWKKLYRSHLHFTPSQTYWSVRLLSSSAVPPRKTKSRPVVTSLPLQVVFKIAANNKITVKLSPHTESIRYLGVWISLKKNNQTVIFMAKRS